MLGLVFLVASLVGLLYLFVQRRYAYWLRNNIPYVKPKFPFGNISLAKNRAHLSQRITEFYRNYKTEQPILGIHFFFNPVPLLVDLELVRCVLIKDFQHFQNRGTFYNESSDPLSAHLFNVDYERWKPLRSKLTPTFSSGKMKFMFPTIVAVANEFVDCLSGIIKTDNEVEVRDLLGRFTTDVIGTCAFGIECNSLKDPEAKFRKMGRKVFDEPYLNAFQRIIIVTCSRLAKLIGMRVHHKDVTDFFMNIVHETVEYREKNDVHRNDFMDLLIQLKNSKQESGGLTMNEIAAQAFVFFLAGFETSSTTLTYALYELALEKNKHIQDKAIEEIQSVLQRHNGELTYEAVTEMVYCDQIINESLRKHPPAANLIRVATKPYDVPNMKFTIPKGMLVLIPVFAIHHDPLYYKQPEEFIPERFSPDDVKKRPSCSFLPFGEGPRNCIGLRFGMLQARIGLICLLKNFEFSTCSRTDIPMEYCAKKLVLSPKDGVWLKVNRRDI